MDRHRFEHGPLAASAFSRKLSYGAALLFTLLIGACTSAELGEAFRSVAPLSTYEVSVVETRNIGPYREAHLVGGGLDLRLLAPGTSEACSALLVDGSEVQYGQPGAFGSVSRADLECDLVGVTSLRAWRDRRGRPVGEAFPRGVARFEEFQRDADLVLVRGRFALLTRMRIPSAGDIVAMLPDTEACARPIERGDAAIVFSDSSAVPYRLSSNNVDCPVVGFALPLGAPAQTP